MQSSAYSADLGICIAKSKRLKLYPLHTTIIRSVDLIQPSDVPFISSREEIKNIWKFSRKISREVKITGNIGNLWEFLKLNSLEQIF